MNTTKACRRAKIAVWQTFIFGQMPERCCTRTTHKWKETECEKKGTTFNDNPVFGQKNYRVWNKKENSPRLKPKREEFSLISPAFRRNSEKNREQIPGVIKSIGVSFFIRILCGIYLLPSMPPCVEKCEATKEPGQPRSHYPQRVNWLDNCLLRVKRTLQVGGRGIIGSIIYNRHHQQQRQYREHSACACKPYTLVERFASYTVRTIPQSTANTDKEKTRAAPRAFLDKVCRYL